MAAQTTSVTIDGARTDLVFGARYRVRFGRAARIIDDGELAARKANGDLVFLDPNTEARISVRPSTIDAIFGSGVYVDGDAATIEGVTPPRRLDGSGDVDYTDAVDATFDFPTSGPVDQPHTDALARELAAQAEVDALVEGFVSDGDRDPDSVAAKVETELRRKRSAVVRGIAGVLDGTATVASVNAELRDLADLSGESIVSPRGDRESAAAYLARLELPVPTGLGAAYTRWIETDPGQRALEAAAREANAARSTKVYALAAKAIETPERRDEIAADAKAILADQPKPRGAKPYSDRNQVWKCGTCKRRTRQPECANGHPTVSAPAGKRAAERLAK